jgi:dihydrofolate reductase
MSKVIFGMTTSLDGFVNDKDGSVARLYPDMEAMRNSDLLQEAMRDTGAVVMGRHSYDMAEGDFTGYEFQVPLFVVTHHPPDVVAKGQNDKLSFTFVNDVKSAIEQAKAAAGHRDVTIVGGPNILQQGLKAGLIDEIQVDVRPLLLTQGLRLFENMESDPIELEITRVEQTPLFTHLRYRVIK